jgi:UDP-N-acetylglucosamine 2-epimerase (non-hydrolysing)
MAARSNTSMRTIHLVAGARPNFMKIAPLYHELKRRDWCVPVLVHTGQHYDLGMSDVFFHDLNLPQPDHSLGIGGGSHGEQLGKVVIAYEKMLAQAPPDLVTVVGDVNATAACTLAAKKLNVPVAHVEAGLRSRDRTMPEEINRIVTDSICDLHLTPSPDADDNLRAEGVPPAGIHFVGNIMIDSLVAMQPVVASRPHPFAKVAGKRYAIATFHRPANVDHPAILRQLADGLTALSQKIPVIFPVHPRTRQRLEASGLLAGLTAADGIILSEPLGYADFMRCLFDAALVVTDSGGVQEETTFLGIACFTARPNTERPITISHGTNRLIAIADIAGLSVPESRREPVTPPALWDGKTASRIADVFERYFAAGAPLRQS